MERTANQKRHVHIRLSCLTVFLAFSICLASVSFAQVQSIVISEMMVHPVNGTNPVDGDLYEFVELQNTGPLAVDLKDAEFTKGIGYVFTNSLLLPTGSFVVVVRDLEAFTNRYPAVTNLAPGLYSGGLANGGEKVTLKDKAGTTLFSVTYGGEAPWPVRADGYGASLVLVDPAVDPDLATNWCASDLLNGSPGESGTCAQPDIVLNEVLTHTDLPLEDAIELHNLTTNAIDVSGWYLSDDVVIRNKYQMTNTVIAAGAYAVVLESQLTSGVPPNVAFALSELGEALFLTAADPSSNLTRFVDFGVFEAAENGVSFGRYPNGTGDWVTLAARSLGAANGLPKTGPLAISEIMYHPPNDSAEDEYIELLNTQATNVYLYDADFPTNTWMLDSAVEFAFPTGAVVSPGERILITGGTNLAAFRASYGLDPSIQVFGPWSGRLNNAGESVRLYRPGAPETNVVPAILVDWVDYSDEAPWPTAPDGNGPSLERISSTNYANDAANWYAGPPGGTPGAAPAGGFVNPVFSPAEPIAGSIFTVSVSVVAATLPTQVVMRTSISSVTNDLQMLDDGVLPDDVAGDQIYTTTVAGQSDGTWVYYLFRATSVGDGSFSLPSPGIRYEPSPPLTVRMSGSGLITNVQPTDVWQTFEVSGAATDPKLVYFYLDAAGEALLDDFSFLDAATETQHAQNGDFESPLTSAWRTNGNHSQSYRDQPLGEASNHVVHMVATAAGSSYANSVNTDLSPTVTVGQASSLSFRTRTVSVEKEAWTWLIVGEAPPAVVINEVMYHPPETNEATYEYVELYNPDASAVDLSGWELKGASFMLPEGATISAGGYLACASATNQIQAKYGITNVQSGWLGSLKNGSETLSLINSFGRTVDRVAYSDRSPWPAAADGYGPSLERVSSEWAGDTSVNWMASSASTNWQQITWTGQIDAANSGVILFLDFDGKCWVDDVSVVPVGGSGEMVPNGDFESGTNDWQVQGNHARSRVEAGMGRGGSAGLALAGALSRWLTKSVSDPLHLRYGDALSNNVYSAALPTTNGEDYVVSLWVRRSGISGSLNAVVDTTIHTLDLSAPGTPGAPNALLPNAWPVGIQEVTQEYSICPVGTQNVVRADLSSSAGITNVQLRYRSFTTNGYEFTDGNYTDLGMADDGIWPDGTAGDGSYAVLLPAYPTNWVFVRYHVLAQTTNGFAARYPQWQDPSADLGYWVDLETPQQNTLPNWYLLTDGGPEFYPEVRRACAVSPTGQAFVDVKVRHRGNPDNDPLRNGLALRVNRDHRLDTWFAGNQGGINFRHRGNNSQYWYFRVVNEYLSYWLQDLIGLPSPRVRHVCLWMDGVPTVTMSLEDPEESFMDEYDILDSDYLARVGWRGRSYVGGDGALNNVQGVMDTLDAVGNPGKPDAIRTNVAMESVRYSMALFSITANIDQFFDWNVFQHRSGLDGRWRQYPWDVDKSFFTQYTNLHPYYQTVLHPNQVNTNYYNLLGQTLYYPESGTGSEYTLPYRSRQQSTLWRYCHTIYTTNFLSPLLDTLYTDVAPAYSQIGYHAGLLSNQVQTVKNFISTRRDFYMNGSWSDSDTNLWAVTNFYDPSGLSINEIMSDPVSGGEYLELYNPGLQTIDLSWWQLRVGDESYRLPHETMLGPTSYLVVADAQIQLTNAYVELSDPAELVERYPTVPLWDYPVVWTSAADYATRVVQVPEITLPASGAVIELLDLRSNLVDSVAYSNTAPWPVVSGSSIEVIDPSSDNQAATNWRVSAFVGTPGWENSATLDTDDDTMADEWEWRIIDASGGLFSDVLEVLPSDDFDEDDLLNLTEWIIGTDPTVSDREAASLLIDRTNGVNAIRFHAAGATGTPYQAYSGRYFTLEGAGALESPQIWSWVTNYVDILGAGQTVIFTNGSITLWEFYRYKIHLQPIRP